MSAKTYTVSGPSELHLGPATVYLPGEAVELTKEAAAPLLADGVVVVPADAREKDLPKGAKRKAAIVAAYKGLDPDNTELRTADGKAKVEALEAALGFDVSADERDEAHAAIEAATKGGEA